MSKILSICSLIIICTTLNVSAQLTAFMAKSDYIKSNHKMGITEITQSGSAVQVTASKYDDIGQILTSIDISFSEYDADEEPEMLFLNCGSATEVAASDLQKFVENGGTLYASDLTNDLLEDAFPNMFKFTTNGEEGEVEAEIVNEELRNILGEKMDIHFDLGNWAVLHEIKRGKVLMQDYHTQRPLMVVVPYGRGRIYYTCFHNHQQPSAQEEDLLKLLVAKQIADIVEQPLSDTAQAMGIDVSKIKSRATN